MKIKNQDKWKPCGFLANYFTFAISQPQPGLTLTCLDSHFSQDRDPQHLPPPSRFSILALWLSCKQSSHLGAVNHISTPQWGHAVNSQIFAIVFLLFSGLWSTLTVFDSTVIMFSAKWSKKLLSYLSFWPLSLHLQPFKVELRDCGWHMLKSCLVKQRPCMREHPNEQMEPLAKTTVGILRRFMALRAFICQSCSVLVTAAAVGCSFHISLSIHTFCHHPPAIIPFSHHSVFLALFLTLSFSSLPVCTCRLLTCLCFRLTFPCHLSIF